MNETIKLDEQDWGELLQGKGVKVGKKIVTVRPYTIGELARLKQVYAGIREAMANDGFTTAEALTSESGMIRLFEYVAANCPELIEMACGLDRADVPKLPIAAGLNIVAEIINVNLESQEGLAEALSYLGKLLAP